MLSLFPTVLLRFSRFIFPFGMYLGRCAYVSEARETRIAQSESHSICFIIMKRFNFLHPSVIE